MAAVASTVAYLISVVVYERVYFNPHANHPGVWLATLVDAGPVFHYLWLTLALFALVLSVLTLPRWQSLVALACCGSHYI